MQASENLHNSGLMQSSKIFDRPVSADGSCGANTVRFAFSFCPTVGTTAEPPR